MKKAKATVRWAAVALGDMQENSKAECMRMVERVHAAIDAGRMRRISRGLYEINPELWDLKSRPNDEGP